MKTFKRQRKKRRFFIRPLRRCRLKNSIEITSDRGSSSKWTGINSKIKKQLVEAINEDELSSYTMPESSFSPSVFIELKQPVKPRENT